ITVLTFILFFHPPSPPPPILPSFPTRRSSDLASPVIENAVGRHVVRTRLRDGVAAISVDALAYLGSFWESMGDVSGEESFTYGRSEEHTSELQSRFDLVCRLLLEKKNKHKTTN